MIASETWLVSKEDYHFNATAVFSGTDVSIITAGYPYVGATIVILLIFKVLVSDKVACRS